MKRGYNTQRFLKRFKNDTSGTMAMLWGLSLTAIVFSVGATFDFIRVSSEKHHAQTVADMLALSAAAYIRDHGEVPNDSAHQALADNVIYTLEELGVDMSSHSYGNDGKTEEEIEAQKTKVVLNYDPVGIPGGVVTATVTGSTNPAFMQLAGVDSINYIKSSTVTYPVTSFKAAASIAFVLDNSASMNVMDRPISEPNQIRRIEGLITSVKSMTKDLRDIDALRADGDSRIIRTSLIGFNERVNNLTKDMNWGIITDPQIDAMRNGLRYGTNSGDGMEKAVKELKGEDDTHFGENLTEKPLKFVVLMTDGANTGHRIGTFCEEIPMPGHHHWEKVRNNGELLIREQTSRPRGRGWYKIYVSEGTLEEYCLPLDSYDHKTKQQCDVLKADTENPATIYTIGFALEPGSYRKPNGTVGQVSKKTSDQAYAMLKYCATTPHHFLVARNSDELDEVFENIGQSIATDVIRIEK